MPDVFVPYVLDPTLAYVNQLIRRGLILRYTINYINQNREMLLETYPNAQAFIENFNVSQSLFNGLIAFARNYELRPTPHCINLHGDRIRTLLKAQIARDLYGDVGFYPIFLPFLDEDFKKAVEILRK